MKPMILQITSLIQNDIFLFLTQQKVPVKIKLVGEIQKQENFLEVFFSLLQQKFHLWDLDFG